MAAASALTLASSSVMMAGVLGSTVRSVKAVCPATFGIGFGHSMAPTRRRLVSCKSGSTKSFEEASKPVLDSLAFQELESMDFHWPEFQVEEECPELEEVLAAVDEEETAAVLDDALREVGAEADMDSRSLARLCIDFLKRQYEGKESCAMDALCAHLLSRGFDDVISAEIHHTFNYYVEDKTKALSKQMIDSWAINL